MTSMAVWDQIRDLVEDKREELKDKYGRRPSQMDVASAAIIRGLEYVDDELGLKKQKIDRVHVKY